MERSDKAGRGDRFGFAIFLSICAHALIVLGIGASLRAESRVDAPLALAIAGFHGDASTPADFRVRENQAAGEPPAAAPATLRESARRAEAVGQAPPPSRIAGADAGDMAVASPAAEDDIANTDIVGESGDEAAADDISRAIADLQARLDRRRQAYAQRPRTYTISSASTRNGHEAVYLDNWRRRVETMGNRNYPAEAERRRLYGSLRLLVSQMPDGSVNDIEILASSGHELLDQSAVSIVRMAAPFEPFPAEMRAEVDILEIIRTWRFHEAEGLTSY